MPVGSNRRCRRDRHILRQTVIQHYAPVLRRDPGGGVKVGHLARAMDPSIGAPSPMQGDRLFELLLQTLLQDPLHTAVMFLPLPAMKIRPKVLNFEGDALSVGNRKSQCHKGSLHQFNHSHFGPISPSLHGADDAGVATVAFAIASGHLLKQGSHQIFVVDVAQRLPPSG